MLRPPPTSPAGHSFSFHCRRQEEGMPPAAIQRYDDAMLRYEDTRHDIDYLLS